MKKYIKPLAAGMGSFIFLICTALMSLAAAEDSHPEISGREYIQQQITPGPTVSELDIMHSKSTSKEYFKQGLNADNITDTECLAFALYSEARGESMNGIMAVAFVIHNRYETGRFGTTYCEIIKQPGEFWYKMRMPRSVDDSNVWEKIMALSYYLINDDGFNKIESPVGKALYFNSLPDQTGLNVKRYIKTIGNHHFYR